MREEVYTFQKLAEAILVVRGIVKSWKLAYAILLTLSGEKQAFAVQLTAAQFISKDYICKSYISFAAILNKQVSP